MSVRIDTSLHPQTVTGVANGAVRPLRHRPRNGSTPEDPLLNLEQVSPALLEGALSAAGGDANRLWFDLDGAVWVLNHTRDTSCASLACPACQDGKRRASRTAW